MLFTAAIDTPANTPKNSPVLTSIPILNGTITQVMVFFPPGSNGLVHLKILWGLVQLFPANEQSDLAGGYVMIAWPESIAIDTEPLSLTCVTWNEDDTFDHTIYVHIVETPAGGTINASDVATQLLSAQQTSTETEPL